MIRIFRHYIPKSLMWLGVSEALVLALSLRAGWPSHDNMSSANPDAGAVVGIFLAVMLFVMMSVGLYRRSRRDDMRKTGLRVVLSIGVGFALMSALSRFTPDLMIGTNALGVASLSALLGVLVTRALFYKFSDMDLMKRHILVIGTGDRAQALEKMIKDGKLPRISVKGYAALPGADPLSYRVSAAKVLRHRHSLSAMVNELEIDELVVALDDRRGSFPTDEILACKMSGTPVTEALAFAERETGTIQLDELRPSNMIFSDGFAQSALKSVQKRIFDLCVGSMLLVAAAPVMVVTALAIWLESGCRGPILYRQQRVGKRGKLFEVLKFRSMSQNAEQDGQARWAIKDDPRVTRVGSFIRKTRIDELPQLLNVLRGEMCFVGPRPERPQFVCELAQKIPYYHLRHYVSPGITGWAQVSYPYGASADDAKAKLQYDLYYLKNYSLFLDFAILLQTVQVCLWGEGAH